MTASDIERQLRDLAAQFTGTAMGQRLPKTDHGASRAFIISVLDSHGHARDVGDVLLSLADDVAQLAQPISVVK